MRWHVAILGLPLAMAACQGGGCPRVPAPEPGPEHRALLDPAAEGVRVAPPDTFDVHFVTSAGELTVRIFREWAPVGAYRFYNLVRNGYYDGNRFYRVIPGFAAQFGAHGVPEVNRIWHEATIPDDPVRVSNERGTITFAAAGPDTRAAQVFINLQTNEGLDPLGFVPMGRVTEGMGTLLALYGEYGDFPPQGAGPDYGCMMEKGNAYLDARFGRLDSIMEARIVREAPGSREDAP